MIRIPDSLFKPSKSDGRKGKVCVYALDKNTIGITAQYENDWGQSCIYNRRITVTRNGSNWLVNLPLVILKHYLLQDSTIKTVVSMNGGRVLITVLREEK